MTRYIPMVVDRPTVAPPEVHEAILADPEFPPGYYARHVLHSGDMPGVLSGAELAGKARKYGHWYARMRDRVAKVAAKHGLHSVYSRAHRRARLWHYVPR